MKTISKLTPNARATETATVTDGIIGEYKKGNWSTDTHLTGRFTELLPLSNNLTLAINRSRAESDLEAKDELRDNNIKALNSLVNGYMYHPDLAIKTAAQKVDVVFERYGIQITNESYASESALIKSMLKDFENEEIQAAIARLSGLSQLIENVKISQIAFEQAQLVYQEEKAKDGDNTNATTIKKDVVAMINDKIVLHLNAMAQIDEAKYGTFAGTVAQIIEDMNVTVKKRKKNPEPVKDAETNNATPKSN